MSECCLLYSLLHSMSVSERLVYLNVCLMKFFELIFNFPNFLTKVQLGIFLMFCFRDWCLSLFCSQSSLTCIPNHQGNVSWFCVVCCDVPRPLVSVHCPLFFLCFCCFLNVNVGAQDCGPTSPFSQFYMTLQNRYLYCT